jgi:hypothetical protein
MVDVVEDGHDEFLIVLCADEKSQIQALDPTQPGLPMKKGRCGTMTYDHKRNGTAALFAALDALDGESHLQNAEEDAAAQSIFGQVADVGRCRR